MVTDAAIGGETKMGDAADTLLGACKARHAEQKIPGEEYLIILQYLRGDDETRIFHLYEHVLMNDRVMLNRAVMSKFGIHLGDVTLSFYKS